MPTTYSHSRLELFDWCSECYKIKYVDKTFPKLPKSMELFLGDMVHQSLEWLYHAIKHRMVSMDDLIEHFANNWNNNFSADIRMRQGTAQDYFHKGIQFLLNYYQSHAPFTEETLSIEQQILFNLDEEGEYKVRGFIDRLVKTPEGYEVHDYKTSKRPKTQAQADSDQQLAFYHLGIKEIYNDVKNVKLIWHFLASNTMVVSSRTDEELVKLREKTVDKIKMIENNTIWTPCDKPWCDWCTWKKNNPEEAAKLVGTPQKATSKNYYVKQDLSKYF